MEHLNVKNCLEKEFKETLAKLRMLEGRLDDELMKNSHICKEKKEQEVITQHRVNFFC